MMTFSRSMDRLSVGVWPLEINHKGPTALLGRPVKRELRVLRSQTTSGHPSPGRYISPRHVSAIAVNHVRMWERRQIKANE